jgi:hypothetical protein
MAIERIGNTGYFSLVKQTDPNVILTPTDFIPLYDESIKTNYNLQRQDPITGSKFGTYDVLPGVRDHTGDFTVMAEPNTAAKLFDALLTKGTSTGSNPTTHPFTLSVLTNPNSYVFDISMSNVVTRYWGCSISAISCDWSDNEMRLKCTMSALGSFQGREIASVSTNVLTLTTTYDQNPTKGLVAGDLVRGTNPTTGVMTDTTVTSITPTTVTLGSGTGFATGDMLTLRPATPSFTLLNSFLWSNSQYCFGSTATAALSATHTPLDVVSWEVDHSFATNEGEKRSGSSDPNSLVRALGDAKFDITKFFDTPEDVRRFNALEKSAVVMRHYAGASRQYELRITLNHIKTDDPIPNIKNGGEINKSEISYIPRLDPTDGQGMDVKVINNLAVI